MVVTTSREFHKKNRLVFLRSEINLFVAGRKTGRTEVATNNVKTVPPLAAETQQARLLTVTGKSYFDSYHV